MFVVILDDFEDIFQTFIFLIFDHKGVEINFPRNCSEPIGNSLECHKKSAFFNLWKKRHK